jgi:hypothetical protein
VTPRLGLTYALGEQRNTLLRASYSRFADQLAQGFSLWASPVSYRYVYFYSYYAKFNRPATASSVPATSPARTGSSPHGFDPQQLRTRDVVDPGFEAPLTDEILLSVEHALRPEFVVGLNLTLPQPPQHGRERAAGARRLPGGRRVNGCFVNEFGELTRVHRRDDYEQIAPLVTTCPTAARPPAVFACVRDLFDDGGDFLSNGDREQDYQGVSLTFNKRLANRWMLRGNFTWSPTGSGTCRIPSARIRTATSQAVAAASATASAPTTAIPCCRARAPARAPRATSSSTASGRTTSPASTRSRPTVRGASTSPATSTAARGTRSRTSAASRAARCGFAECSPGSSVAIAVAGPDEFRNDDIHLLDLRLEKDFQIGEVNLTVLGEVFNVFNEATPLQTQARINQAGSTAGVPFRVAAGDYLVEVVSPRVFRLGARFAWR